MTALTDRCCKLVAANGFGYHMADLTDDEVQGFFKVGASLEKQTTSVPVTNRMLAPRF